jgi:ribosome-binding protein aMBF1 (putative translation factor)
MTPDQGPSNSFGSSRDSDSSGGLGSTGGSDSPPGDLPFGKGEALGRDRALEALGRAVRRRRKDLGLSQEALSARAGLHENYVGGVERGERNTSIVNVLKLTGALELRPSELMSRLEAELQLMDEIGE